MTILLSRLTANKNNSVYNRQIDVSLRSGIIASDTTKDHSLIQNGISSFRTKEAVSWKQRVGKINRDSFSDQGIDNKTISEGNSIFTQNLVFQNKTPVKKRLNNTMKKSNLSNEVSSPVSQANDVEILNEYHPQKYISDLENSSSNRYNRK